MTSRDPRPHAIIASRIFEPEGAAAAYRLGNLFRALERVGFHVTVLTTKSPGARRSAPRIRRWPVLRDSSGSVRGYVQYASFDVPLLFRLLFSRRPQVVIAEPPPTTGVVTRIVCSIRRIPYVYYSADVTSAAVTNIGVSRLVVRIVTAMERWVLDGASGVLAVSGGVEMELEKLGTTASKITMVGTGIDTDLFRSDGPSGPSELPYFIYAGTMSEFQGAQVFIDAFAEVASTNPDARLVVFGGGTDLEKMRHRAAPLGDRVQFFGIVDAEIVARWIRGAVASLASVRPGRGYDFAIPTKTLASVACGTAVIFAGVGPLRQIVSDRELGWSVEWSVAQVVQAMEAALVGPRRRLNQESLQWLADNYSLKAVATKAAAAVAQVANGEARQRTGDAPD